MNLKEKLKNNDILRRIVKKNKIKKEFLTDFKDFNSYYNDSGNESIETLEYKIMLLVHSLEKGMCHKELRPFGEKKIQELIFLMTEYIKISENLETTPLEMGYSVVKKWVEIYDANAFDKNDVYNNSKKFLRKYQNIHIVNTGAYKYQIAEAKKANQINYYDFISSRHSVREFSHKRISKEDIEYCVKSAIHTPTACNRQMVKIYSIISNSKKEILNDSLMGLSGFDKESINYFVITFDISAFSFYGERNQGFFNAGLVAMNFANAMHNKQIGSCFLQWGNTSIEEKHIKEKLGIPSKEKIAVVLAAGYYLEETLVPQSHRKSLCEIYREL